MVNTILNAFKVAEIRKIACYEGMRTLQEEGARLVQTGITTVAEVFRLRG